MSVTPLLLVSDNPNGSTGLATITREIATRAQQSLSDVCDVAVAGYGGGRENRLPFPVFPYTELRNWSIPDLPWIWKRFAGDRKGIICTIWNIAWLIWMTHPENLQYGELQDFLMSGRFKLWSYVPVDSVCLNGRLSGNEEKILRKIDRVLAYTKFGADAIDQTLGNDLGTTPYIPHGTDDTIFYPRSRKVARMTLLSRIGKGNGAVTDDIILVGIFATNTARKDWALGLEVCGRLVQKGYNIGVLLHTDTMQRDWNLTELCLGFGLKGRVIESTQPIAREEMPWLYAACDVTLGIGAGEGWGLPLSESMAMGVPVVHGRYAGGSEFVPEEWTVEPSVWRYESLYANKRPMFHVENWVRVVESIMIPSNDPRKSFLNRKLMWDAVWPRFEKWIREGLELTEPKFTVKPIPGREFSDLFGPKQEELVRSVHEDGKPKIDLERVKALNYEHHRKMTRDHVATDEAENARIMRVDDDSFRALLKDVPKGKDLLELGSASGTQWGALKEWADNLTGIDLYEPAVKASQTAGLCIILGFVEKMPFPSESFDIVCSRHVMEHVSDIQQALSEIKRVLRPGGYVAAVTPHRFPDYEPAHIQQLWIAEWETEYLRAGFVDVKGYIREFNCVEAHIVARKPDGKH